MRLPTSLLEEVWCETPVLETLTRDSWRKSRAKCLLSRLDAEVSTRRVSPTRVSCKNVPRSNQGVTKLCHRNVARLCATSVSHQCVPQDHLLQECLLQGCPTRASHKNVVHESIPQDRVLQGCPTRASSHNRVSNKSVVAQECPTGVRRCQERLLQECPIKSVVRNVRPFGSSACVHSGSWVLVLCLRYWELARSLGQISLHPPSVNHMDPENDWATEMNNSDEFD